MLERLFRLSDRGTTVGTEVVAGLTTFLTMAYILFVHPRMLAEAGMDAGAVYVATCLAAAVGCALMGTLANQPVALAPGMGLNAWFAYAVVLGQGVPWPVALGAVFWSGVAFFLLGVVGVRRRLITAIPRGLRLGLAAGVGWFLALIGLKAAGVVVASPATLLTLGALSAPGPVLALGGVALTLGLAQRRVPGATLWAVLVTTVVAWAAGLATPSGLFARPPDPSPTWGALALTEALDPALAGVIVAFLFVDLFDTAGTLVGLSQRSGLRGPDGELPDLDRAMTADSLATIAGAVLGTSTVTSYVESAAGVAAGGRTGLTALVVGACFLAALVASPLAASVPAVATTGALVYVAVLMSEGLTELDDDLTERGPALVAALGVPLSFSIAHGLALGVLTYVGAKLAAGRVHEVGIWMWALAAIFVAHFALG